MSEGEIADWQQLLARGEGLVAIRALLAQHESQRAAQAETEAAASPPPAAQSATSSSEPHALQSAPEPFELEVGGDTTTARLKKRRITPRRVAIMVAGYLISALVGTAIGYYILMRIDPSWNWWHLKLPGLRDAPAASARFE